MKLNKDLEKIFLALDNKVRIIGGAVRDYLNNKVINDYDLACEYTPEQIQEKLTQNNIKALPTGIKYGTITALLDRPYEITSLRKDIKCNGRHVEVEYCNSYELDAKRRDFTINAISIDHQGKVYDYFNGQQDLKLGIVKFIGNPKERILEDNLRILRFFRFYGLYGNCDEESYLASIDNFELIQNLSPERVRAELIKILQNTPNILTKLDRKLKYLIPLNVDFNNLEDLNWQERLTSILKNNSLEKIKEFLKSLRFSNDEQKLILNLSVKFDRKNILKFGKDILLSRLNIENKYRDVSKDKDFVTEFNKEFPVNGDDILALGFKGKEIGLILSNLEELWHEDYSQDKNQLLSKIVMDKA